MSTRPGRRAVEILGPGVGHVPELSEGDLADVARVLVIGIGWPLERGQRAAAEDAMAVARRRAIGFEAVLVASPADAASELDPSDRIRVLGSPRDRRRIETAVGLAQRS